MKTIVFYLTFALTRWNLIIRYANIKLKTCGQPKKKKHKNVQSLDRNTLGFKIIINSFVKLIDKKQPRRNKGRVLFFPV